jgi:hypothetical protein
MMSCKTSQPLFTLRPCSRGASSKCIARLYTCLCKLHIHLPTGRAAPSTPVYLEALFYYNQPKGKCTT